MASGVKTWQFLRMIHACVGAHVLRILIILRLTSCNSRKPGQTPLICETEPSEV